MSNIVLFGGLDGVSEHDGRSEQNRANDHADRDQRDHGVVEIDGEGHKKQGDGGGKEQVADAIGAPRPQGNRRATNSDGIGRRLRGWGVAHDEFSLGGRVGTGYGSHVAVLVEWFETVCRVVIDRPEKRNAVDLETLTALRDAQSVAMSGGARALVLTGTPPAFCSGADLTGVELGEFTDMLLTVLRGFGSLDCVTLAAIDGPALGAGSQLAAACDLRCATPTSKFGVPAAKLGLAVDSWTVERIGREAGWSAARYMLLSAEPMAAQDLAGSFVHRLGTLDDAMNWAHEMSLLAPLTIKAHKMALERLAGAEISLEAVEHARLAAWASDDANEGRQAFLEKRKPGFTGR